LDYLKLLRRTREIALGLHLKKFGALSWREVGGKQCLNRHHPGRWKGDDTMTFANLRFIEVVAQFLADEWELLVREPQGHANRERLRLFDRSFGFVNDGSTEPAVVQRKP
jgi:hypothetical protein